MHNVFCKTFLRIKRVYTCTALCTNDKSEYLVNLYLQRFQHRLHRVCKKSLKIKFMIYSEKWYLCHYESSWLRFHNIFLSAKSTMAYFSRICQAIFFCKAACCKRPCNLQNTCSNIYIMMEHRKNSQYNILTSFIILKMHIAMGIQ